MNPFKFGDPVEGEFYLQRPELDASVYNFLSNRIHVDRSKTFWKNIFYI